VVWDFGLITRPVSDQQDSVLVLGLLTAVLVYGLGLVNYDLGVEKFSGAFTWQSSEQPIVERRQTSLFASYTAT